MVLFYGFCFLFIFFAVKVGGMRVPVPKHHEEKVEAPKEEEADADKYVVFCFRMACVYLKKCVFFHPLN